MNVRKSLSDAKIGIIGGSMGMGSWLVKFCQQHQWNVKFSSQDEKTQFSSNQELVEWADLIFLAVPIAAMTSVLEEIYPFLHQKTLIDVCSVKKFIFDKFSELSQRYPHVQVAYGSIHPMFSQTIQQLTGQVMILMAENPENAYLQELEKIWLTNGAFLYRLGYIEHDKIMGLVQGLNHFSVFVSAKTLQQLNYPLETIKQLSSPAYRIFVIFFTRYVLQNPSLYADIQIYNEFVLEVVNSFKEEVEKLYQIISQKDKKAFVEYVSKAQPYFSGNVIDNKLSNHLIEQLGIFLKTENASRQAE